MAGVSRELLAERVRYWPGLIEEHSQSGLSRCLTVEVERLRLLRSISGVQNRKTKGIRSRRASLTMMFKLAQSASEKWKRLRGSDNNAFVIEGRSFKDSMLQEEIAA